MLLTWLLSFSGYGQADKSRKLSRTPAADKRGAGAAGQTLATVCATSLMLYQILKCQMAERDGVRFGHTLHSSGEK